MRRLIVFEIDGAWTFAPGADARRTWPQLLDAANAAAEFGQTFRGAAAGFVVRLLVPNLAQDTVTLYSHVFSGSPRTSIL